MPVDDKPELDKTKMSASTSHLGPVAATGQGAKAMRGLSPDIQAQIGRKLTAVYDAVLQQPVPDRFRLLLEQLDAKTAAAPKKGEPG